MTLQNEIVWKKLELEDKELLDSYYRLEDSDSCEFVFANIWLWSPLYETRFSIIDGLLVFITDESDLSVSFPRGTGDKAKVIQRLQEYFESKNRSFKMHLVSEEQFAQLEEMFPSKYQIVYNENESDYVYEREKLATLAGKKLHAKRNHINRFVETYPDWSYETITDCNVNECIEMAVKWKEQEEFSDETEKSEEWNITITALQNLQRLELKGGLIRADGEVVAFSIGEPCSSDTFVVHIEKAFGQIQGAYPMINQQFVLHETEGYSFINREDDAGSEGLRKAKQSYYPVRMIKKGLVTLVK